jgi:hypothetical protein
MIVAPDRSVGVRGLPDLFPKERGSVRTSDSTRF